MNIHIFRHEPMMSINFRFKIKNSANEFEGSTSENSITLNDEVHQLSDLRTVIYYSNNNDITLIDKNGNRTAFIVTEAKVGRSFSQKPPFRYIIDSLDEIIDTNKLNVEFQNGDQIVKDKQCLIS
jgi:hypothetical protein